MADYKRSATIEADPDELFEYLSKVENLPKYFSGLSEAHSTTGDEVHVVAEPQPGEQGPPERVESDAWFSVDADRRALSWGAEGPHDYRGELRVTSAAEDGKAARIEVTLHTQHAHDGIEAGIDDTLGHIRTLVTEGKAG